MKNLITEIRISLVATLCLATILCGVYPLSIWIVAQGLFPARANGSFVARGGTILGSSLIGQEFTDGKYFHPRPSAAGRGYDACSSGGSNLGPTSGKLIDAVGRRVVEYRRENSLSSDILVPADAVTSSASGLDPHISLRNALLQAPRVARARRLSERTIREQIEAHIQGRDLGILGEPRVNVLMLNLALDGASK
ncbi:MAG: K(+)-transporting ATPase subunit C [Candidatus Eisenbacteria bacterium]|nr:K(+)-transporting ATPase subunit C [Candidatus Eisenbacteria bacterium]